MTRTKQTERKIYRRRSSKRNRSRDSSPKYEENYCEDFKANELTDIVAAYTNAAVNRFEYIIDMVVAKT